MPTPDAFNEVKIILGDAEVFIAEGYQVTMGVVQQPCAFAVDLGDNAVVNHIIDKYPPNTKFELHVGGVTQFVGRTDGWTVSGGPGGTRVVLRGRDSMAPIWDGYPTSEKSWDKITCAELTEKVLDETIGKGKWTLELGNEAHRQAISGTKTRERKASGRFAKSASKKTVQSKLGMNWYSDLLKPALDRWGLFLMATEKENAFVLTTANSDQESYAQITRKRGAITNLVESYSYKNEPTRRFSQIDVHGRRGGGKEARSKIVVSLVDDEMSEYGYYRPLVISDEKCTTEEHAMFLARRTASELRRQAWSLEYQLRGHVTEGINSRLADGYVLWSPDTVVQIEDEDIGISGPHYLESVMFSAQPQANTTLRFMRPDDVLYGTDDGNGE